MRPPWKQQGGSSNNQKQCDAAVPLLGAPAQDQARAERRLHLHVCWSSHGAESTRRPSAREWLHGVHSHGKCHSSRLGKHGPACGTPFHEVRHRNERVLTHPRDTHTLISQKQGRKAGTRGWKGWGWGWGRGRQLQVDNRSNFGGSAAPECQHGPRQLSTCTQLIQKIPNASNRATVNVCDSGCGNYPDLITGSCTRGLEHHTVPYKYVKLSHVTQKQILSKRL